MNTAITLHMEPDMQAQMVAVCQKLGITPETAFTLFAKAMIRENKLPFDTHQNLHILSKDTILADADDILEEYKEDYERLAK
jgi:addiction module RelB/DinJ family antitoxin